MKKRKLILIIGSLVLISTMVVTFAAFIFHRVVAGIATTGTIIADEMYFVVYSENGSNNKVEEISAKGKSFNFYATKKQGWSGETDDYQLNQLEIKFTYKTTMDVYVRVHIQDAWISTKTYTNGIVNTSYIEKDKIKDGSEESSPFKPDSSDWIYDEMTNCIYYKQKVSLTETNGTTTKLAEKEVTQNFRLNSTYFYKTENSTSYREHVIVQVSYYVDIVQANRAEKKWQVSFSDLGIA